MLFHFISVSFHVLKFNAITIKSIIDIRERTGQELIDLVCASDNVHKG